MLPQTYYHHLHEEWLEVIQKKQRIRTRKGFLMVYYQLLVGVTGAGGEVPVPLEWELVKEFFFDYCGLPDITALDSKRLHQQQEQFRNDVQRFFLLSKVVLNPDSASHDKGCVHAEGGNGKGAAWTRYRHILTATTTMPVLLCSFDKHFLPSRSGVLGAVDGPVSLLPCCVCAAAVTPSS